MFSCNVDGILNDLPGVVFIDRAADWKAAPIGGFNMPPEHSVQMNVSAAIVVDRAASRAGDDDC